MYNTITVLQDGVICKRSVKQHVPFSHCWKIGLFNSKYTMGWQLPTLATFSVWNYLVVCDLPLKTTNHTQRNSALHWKGSGLCHSRVEQQVGWVLAYPAALVLSVQPPQHLFLSSQVCDHPPGAQVWLPWDLGGISSSVHLFSDILD